MSNRLIGGSRWITGGPFMNELHLYWETILNHFKPLVSKGLYEFLFEPVVPRLLENNTLYCEVDEPVQKEQWEKNYIKAAMQLLYETYNHNILIRVQLKNETKPVSAKEGLLPTQRDVPLNPQYTFENFVVGAGNRMAHAAALVVAESPGEMYNPLFFYGGVGLGKTHLMHSIGNHLKSIRPNAKIKYVTSEKFTNDFIQSIQTNSAEAFRNEYRSVDLLLVDDVQFLANKEATQEEFFHTFNYLYDLKKQIVLTSDRKPNEIASLPDRLVTRFGWGLLSDITPPDLETRIAILRNKSNNMRIDILDDVLSYISGQFNSNVRDLEGALTRVQFYAVAQRKDITTDLAAEALKDMVSDSNNTPLTVYDIQHAVGTYFNVTVEELKGKKRTKNIVVPRQIAMYLSRELTSNSLLLIGREFGGKDHTTVLHACDKIHQSALEDSRLSQAIKELKQKLKK